MHTIPDRYAISRLEARGVRAAASDLAAVLIDCVDGGASVSFMSGLDEAKALAFWVDVAASAAHDGRVVLVASRTHDQRIVGTVQMIPARVENQPHRADIAKMLVLRAERRRGVGAALMRAAEEAAMAAGKTLLTLDTASADAERLYLSSGWTQAGRIPDYALLPDGRPCATTIFFKRIAGGRAQTSSSV
jgi:GNAT superfamily N-acetyltransferase